MMIYERRSDQTVCTMKNEKGRSCHGSLKIYRPFAKTYGEIDPELKQEIEQQFGRSVELSLYKCNYCNTVYVDA